MNDLVPIDSDLDTAARLVLLDRPDAGLVAVTRELRRRGYDQFGALEMRELWTRYRGWDGRTSPTHDIDTGRRIGRG